jgi:hypothetical protein
MIPYAVQRDLQWFKEQADQILAHPELPNLQTKKIALTILNGLRTRLERADLAPEAWAAISKELEPYALLDLSEEPNPDLWVRVSSYVASFFTKKTLAISEVKDFSEEQRENAVRKLDTEKRIINEEYQKLAEKHWNHESDLKNAIDQSRRLRPRLHVSLKEELEILKGLSVNNERMHSQLQAIDSTLSPIEKNAESHSSIPGTLVLVAKRTQLDQQTIDNELRPDRLHRLQNLEEEYQKTLQDPSRQIVSKCFPETSCWYMGADHDVPLFELEMSKIANENNIGVISDYYSMLDLKKSFKNQYNNSRIIFFDFLELREKEIGAFGGVWAQDFLDFNQQGSIQIPVMQTAEEAASSRGETQRRWDESIAKARKERSLIWQNIYEENGTSPILTLGQSFSAQRSTKGVALASALDVPVSMNLTYNEGGNTIIGQKGSKPYVIIGKDSYSISKSLMEKDLGREMSDDEVCMAFAIDYGVAKEDVHFVEQPGDFHLDMCMTIVGENTVLLNDSEEAQKEFEKEQEKWLQEMKQGERTVSQLPYFEEQVKEERAAAKIRKKLEDAAEMDLKNKGFNVVRVPGKFNYSSQNPAMNLFNMVTAKTPDGRNIAILLGCLDKQYEDRFKEILRTNCDQEIDEIYFLPIEASRLSLFFAGGIACRTKAYPKLR